MTTPKNLILIIGILTGCQNKTPYEPTNETNLSKNIHLASRFPAKTDAQVDFINKHYDYVTTPVLKDEIREQVQGPKLFLHRSIQGTWTNFDHFDWAHIDTHENMFCHHNGNRIITIWNSWLMDGSDLVDPSEPDALNHWINYYAVTASEQVHNFNYDGLFIDSASHRLVRSTVYELMPDDYSDENWRDSRYTALEFIKFYFSDKTVTFNGLHSGNGAEHSLALTDGGMWEGFAFKDGEYYVGEEQWKEVIELAERNNEEKIISIVSKKYHLTSDIQARMFVLASYLLVSNQNVLLTMIDLNYDQLESIYYYPEYEINLGIPLGSYTIKDNTIYERKFEKGIVLVNPSSIESYTYSLDKEYNKVVPEGGGVLQEDGTCKGSLTYEAVNNEIVLPPISGVVLINR